MIRLLNKLRRQPKRRLLLLVLATTVSCSCVVCHLTSRDTAISIVLTNVPTATPTPTPMIVPTSILAVTTTRDIEAKATSTSVPATQPSSVPTVYPSRWMCPDSTAGAAYVASVESDKFHVPTCRYAREILSENRVCFSSRDAAVSAGYEPCGVCTP
jgi:hypothetical protein